MNTKSIISILLVLLCFKTVSVFAQNFDTGSIKITNTTEEIFGKDAALQYEDIISIDEKNIIFIKLHVTGRLTLKKELFLSILAPVMLQQKYRVDTSRIYTSSKNGCISAGNIAKTYPNIIKGALYINCHPATWRDEEPANIELMRDNRYLFISGMFRSEYVDNKQELRKYHDAGILNAKYVRTAAIKKFDNLTRPILSDAIDYLDGKDDVGLLKKVK